MISCEYKQLFIMNFDSGVGSRSRQTSDFDSGVGSRSRSKIHRLRSSVYNTEVNFYSDQTPQKVTSAFSHRGSHGSTTFDIFDPCYIFDIFCIFPIVFTLIPTQIPSAAIVLFVGPLIFYSKGYVCPDCLSVRLSVRYQVRFDRNKSLSQISTMDREMASAVTTTLEPRHEELGLAEETYSIDHMNFRIVRLECRLVSYQATFVQLRCSLHGQSIWTKACPAVLASL